MISLVCRPTPPHKPRKTVCTYTCFLRMLLLLQLQILLLLLVAAADPAGCGVPLLLPIVWP